MQLNHPSRLLQQYLAAKNEGKEPYFDAGDINDLLESFEESEDYTYYDEVLALGLKLHPYDTELQVKRCQQIIEEGNYREALTSLELLPDTDYQDLNMLKIECYCSLNLFPKAFRLVKKLEREHCEYLKDIFEYIAPILNELEMNEEAKTFIKEGLKLYPDNMILLNEYSLLLENMSDFQEAIKICDQLIDKNPFDFECWFTLGRLYSLVGNFEKAIESFDYALTCDNAEDTNELKILRAYCLYMNESYEKAIEAYWDIYSEEDKDTMLRIIPLLSDSYIKCGDFKDGYKLLNHFLENNTDPIKEGPSLYMDLAQCCFFTDNFDKIFYHLDKAIKIYPKSMRLLGCYVFYIIQLKSLNTAYEAVERILDKPEIICTNEKFISLLHSGQKLFLEKKYNEAIIEFKKALEYQQDSSFVYTMLALAYANLKDLHKVIDYLAKSMKDDTENSFKEENPYAKFVHKKDKENMIEPIYLALQYINNSDNKN